MPVTPDDPDYREILKAAKESAQKEWDEIRRQKDTARPQRCEVNNYGVLVPRKNAKNK